MEIFVTIALFVLGIVLLVKGGDFFVDAASWMAEVSGIPKLIIGATIVSIATTLPEMLVSVMAATQGKVDMSIGNAVGSVTANIGLIMAIALIFMPGVISRKEYFSKALLMLSAAVLIVICGFFGQVNGTFSVMLIIIFTAFFSDSIVMAKKNMDENSTKEKDPSLTGKKTVIINIIKFIAGAAGIIWGSDLLVDNGAALARLLGVSERIIGVTLVAIGTSLPELVTTLTAISKKQSALSVGNILGANIMDLSLIMPMSAIISGQDLPVSKIGATIDLPACLLVGLIAVVPAMIKEKFSRWQGFVLLAVYAAYVIITCFVV